MLIRCSWWRSRTSKLWKLRADVWSWAGNLRFPVWPRWRISFVARTSCKLCEITQLLTKFPWSVKFRMKKKFKTRISPELRLRWVSRMRQWRGLSESRLSWDCRSASGALLDNNFAESYAEWSLAGVYEEDHDCNYACDLVIACFSVCLRWLDQMRDAERSAASAAYASRFFVDARWFVARDGAQRSRAGRHIPSRSWSGSQGLI